MYNKLSTTIAFFIFLVCSIPLASAQAVQKIGDNSYTISPSALFEIESTTKGFLPPRMTSDQRNAIDSPAVGLTIYNTTNDCIESNTLLGWIVSAVVTGLNCPGAVFSGTPPIGGTTTTNYFVTLPYTGGNSKVYNSQLIPSTGVTGLMAELKPGILSNNAGGNVVFSISGSAITGGVASFSFTFAGQACVFTVNVGMPGTAVLDNCSSATAGILTSGVAASGVTQTMHYIAGNGAAYDAVGFASTGVTGLVASLSAGTLAAGSGSVDLSITGTPAGSGTASFVVTFAGSTCSFTRTVAAAAPATLPVQSGSIVLAPPSVYFIGSVYDSNYLPYTTAISFAALPGGALDAPDGTTDPVIDVQGTLSVVGVPIDIKYTVTGSSFTLPAFTQTVSVVSANTQDGISRDITLSYAGATLAVGTGYITAMLKSESGGLYAKKLDIQTGIGADNLGLLLGEFNLAINSAGGTSKFQLRDIAAIPDRNIADVSHRMFYFPIVSSRTGKVWLNNNLGADYSNRSKGVFNPSQQGTSPSDFNAYGSLYQWGRNSDGHELINWTNATNGVGVNGTTTTLSVSDTPDDSQFIKSTASPNDWRSPEQNNNLWQGVTGGINNPCPSGYRVPADTEMTTEANAYSINYSFNTNNSIFKFVFAGFRYNDDAMFDAVGNCGSYWSSTVSGTNANLRYFCDTGSTNSYFANRAIGFSVRCLKD